MKSLLLGLLLIILVGVGGLVYRNAVEHPNEPIACPVDAKVCPDGTSVAREGTSCAFPACPPPNVALGAPINIAYAVPAGLSAVTPAAGGALAQYDLPLPAAPIASTTASSTEPALPPGPSSIVITRYAIEASSTALATIQATALGGASGAPVPQASYSAANIGDHRFTVVPIERFEGVVETSYYLARAGDVLRFDAVDRGVAGWSDPALDTSALPAASALKALLATLQGV